MPSPRKPTAGGGAAPRGFALCLLRRRTKLRAWQTTRSRQLCRCVRSTHVPVCLASLSAATTRAFWARVSLPITVARRAASTNSPAPSLASSGPARKRLNRTRGLGDNATALMCQCACPASLLPALCKRRPAAFRRQLGQLIANWSFSHGKTNSTHSWPCLLWRAGPGCQPVGTRGRPPRRRPPSALSAPLQIKERGQSGVDDCLACPPARLPAWLSAGQPAAAAPADARHSDVEQPAGAPYPPTHPSHATLPHLTWRAARPPPAGPTPWAGPERQGSPQSACRPHHPPKS